MSTKVTTCFLTMGDNHLLPYLIKIITQTTFANLLRAKFNFYIFAKIINCLKVGLFINTLISD